MAFIGTTFLLLSPRIFADSFYNNKDIIFLSFFIINIYTAINFFEKQKIQKYLSYKSRILIKKQLNDSINDAFIKAKKNKPMNYNQFQELKSEK